MPNVIGLDHIYIAVANLERSRQFGYVLRPATGGARGIDASVPKLYPEYAPDDVATFLADPDGLRLEITNSRAERRHRYDQWEDEPAA